MSALFGIPATHRLARLIAGFVMLISLLMLLMLLLSSGVSAQANLRTTPDQSTIYYVDAAKTAGANDGSSWTDAFTSLQLALDLVQAGDQIWVAQGVYTPSKRTEQDDARSATFDLVNGVALYGGFPGTPGSEGDMEGRDWEVYATVLSGDIDGNDVVDERGVVTDTANILGENAYHVVMAEEVDETTLLDGFFITAGAAAGESSRQDLGGGLYSWSSYLAIRQVNFSANSADYGGGMYSEYGSPELTKVTFAANSASAHGGGMYNRNSSPWLTHVIFTANSANGVGGGLYNEHTTSYNLHGAVLTSVVFVANTARWGGGGMYLAAYIEEDDLNVTTILTHVTFAATSAGEYANGLYIDQDTNLLIQNSVIWGLIHGDSATISDSLVHGGCPEFVTCNGKLLDVDPRFMRPPDPGDGDWSTLDDNDYGDLRLQADSPAIDAGNNDWTPVFLSSDIDGNPRVVGARVDLGAYEAFGLKISKAVEPPLVEAPGAAITYTLHIRNFQDTSSVSGIKLSDQIPHEVMISEIKTEGVGTNQTGTPPFYIWEIEELLPQTYSTIILSGRLKPEVASGDSFTNTASLTAASGDPILDDNTANVHSYIPTIRYVDIDKTAGADNGASWTDAYTSLQSALDVARAGDQIWVAEGVYTPSKRVDAEDTRSATFKLGNGIALYGGFSGIPGQEGDFSARNWRTYPTVLSGDIDGNDLVDMRGVSTSTEHIVGENACTVLTVKYVDRTTVLEGFFITAGKSSLGLGSESCEYDYSGGGMRNFVANPTVTDVVFTANFASMGGGMYNGGSSPTLSNVTFTANLARYEGGGMYNGGSSPTLSNVTFTANLANEGGGMYNDGGSPTLSNVTFTANLADEGGGMYNGGGSPTLSNVTFTANLADERGGGMYNGFSSPTLTNVTFAANSADEKGGGMYNYRGSPTLTNVTFAANSARHEGSDVYIYEGAISVRNSIFWESVGSVVYSDSNSHTTIYDSLVKGGCPHRVTCVGQVLDIDPRFMRLPDPGDGDWRTLEDNDYGDLRLQAGSPAIDAGNNVWLPSDVPTDVSGNPRIVGGVVDMGAHETFGLKIGKAVAPTTIEPGAAITYTLQVHNYQDTDSVTSIQITDSIPQEVSITAVKTEGATLIQIGAAPHYVWEIEELIPQEYSIITLSGEVKSDVNPPFNFTNSVAITAASGDPVSDDNSVSVQSVARDTIYVDVSKTGGANSGANWADAFTSLQSALDVAQAGDQVWVAQGVYVPSKRVDEDDPRSATFNLVNGVALYGGFSGTPGQEDDFSARDWQIYPTVLSGDIDGNDSVDARGVLTTTEHLVGENAYHVLMAEGVDERTLLQGFIVTAGQAMDGSDGQNRGGGMYISFADPTLSDLTFSANSAFTGGGLVNWASSPDLTHITFTANSSEFVGGGMSNYSSSEFVGMSSYSGSAPILTDVSFFANSAPYGGGMYNHSGSSPTLTNVTFVANSATEGGGGGMSNARNSPTLTNVTFTANSAKEGGGGIQNYESTSTLTNVAFAANSAGNEGGGMWNRRGFSVLTNVTFAANSAGTEGEGIYSDDIVPLIRNSIFWGHDGLAIYGENTTLYDSLVQGGCPESATCSGRFLDDDPHFIRLPNPGDGDWTTLEDNDYGDLRLQADSPAIDAGNNDWLPSDSSDLDGDGDTAEPIPYDLQGFPRIVGDAVDLGAYEYIKLNQSLWLPSILR